jgi:hypothetical protein
LKVPTDEHDDTTLASRTAPTFCLENERDDVILIALYAFIRKDLPKELVDGIDAAISDMNVEGIINEIKEKMKII